MNTKQKSGKIYLGMKNKSKSRINSTNGERNGIRDTDTGALLGFS